MTFQVVVVRRISREVYHRLDTLEGATNGGEIRNVGLDAFDTLDQTSIQRAYFVVIRESSYHQAPQSDHSSL